MFSLLIVSIVLVSASAFCTSSSGARVGRMSSLEMARKPLIAGNWKLNTDLTSAKALATELVALTQGVDFNEREIAVCPPFPFLTEVNKILKTGSQNIALGAQNVLGSADSGAFTGEVSAPMVKSVGAKYALVGHSERRAIFGENDAGVNNALLRVQAAGLIPILCVGETQEEYELGITNSVNTLQLSKGLKGLSGDQVAKVVIAYEPVWAIGTGLSATPDIAQGVHFAIRSWLRQTYGDTVAEQVIIQYGGSVKPDTVDELMACPDIDGTLVGGASLSAKDFARICNFETTN